MSSQKFDQLDPRKFILIKGARMHNLKNIDVAIPRNKLVVITGLSGSGKSSLAFDTLYAEGQRRYVESLSSYARQFLGKVNKPDVDYIKGVAPAIAIEQKVNSTNARSTVGTVTEIYDYLKLLYARIGRTYSPISGDEVKKNTVKDVTDLFETLEDGTKGLIITPLLVKMGRTQKEQIDLLLQQGYSRLFIDDTIIKIEDLDEKSISKKSTLYLIIDRFITKKDEETVSRIADSTETAFFEGNGDALVAVLKSDKTYELHNFSNRFEADGMEFTEPNVHFFSFNNPIGACPKCDGYGKVIGVDEHLVIPNPALTVYENAIAPWVGEKMSEWKDQLIYNAEKFDFPIHKPIDELTPAQYKLLWRGNEHFNGLDTFFEYLEKKTYKIQYRVMLARYRGKTKCPACDGKRLKEATDYVKIDGHSLSDLVIMPVDELHPLFTDLTLNTYDATVAKRLLIEIKNRLKYLNDVGVGYLTLNRNSSTLSGGESQRINLATSLGSSLVGSMYILDEPSIGLHPKDTERLIVILKSLRDLGNTVIVVEHDEEIILAADEVIDLGPLAGTHGGELIFQGNQKELLADSKSLTARYINGKEEIATPDKTRKWKESITLKKVKHHNLKGFDVKIPLECMVVVTGVSGSGKSTLIKSIFYPALKKLKGGIADKTGDFSGIEGNVNLFNQIEFIDQNPIGKSSRSNPVTYVKAYDEIRALYAGLPLSKKRGYKAGHFSFNIDGGRCDVCQGEGEVTIEMQFMADIHLVCEECNGKRFKDEVLEVQYNNKSISDILEMTIEDAIEFFQMDEKNRTIKKIVDKLTPLYDVGLGYVKLGQSSSTLSGGEAQRIKLAFYLAKGESKNKTVFLFDEPTTGLHFHDINKLLYAFNALIEQGHSLIIIEHNPDVIKCADWVIDLGPEGGKNGGNLLFEGTPKDLAKCKKSITGQYIKP
jgi:excinuclease ABC subunit A